MWSSAFVKGKQTSPNLVSVALLALNAEVEIANGIPIPFPQVAVHFPDEPINAARQIATNQA